jgi:hypothetical protein
MKVNLIFSHKPSGINKKLIKFFQINLLSFNKANVIFEFEVAHPENSDQYKQKGIINYPTLLQGSKIITGSDKIIQYLKNIVNQFNKKILNKSESEKLDDFWKQTIGKIEVDASGNVKPIDEDDDDVSEDLHHKIQQAFKDRSSSTDVGKVNKKSDHRKQHTTNNTEYRSNNIDESPLETLKNMNSKGGNHMDDELMAKFFENQESSI